MKLRYSHTHLAYALITMVTSLVPCAQADPKISATATSIQLQDGQTSACATLVFKIEGLKKEQVSIVPDIAALRASQGGPQLTILGKSTLVAPLETGAFWQVPVRIDGLPLNSSVVMPVLVHVDETVGEVLSYTLTNVLPAVDADVSPGSDTIFLNKSRETDFLVNVKGRPLRGLSVCQSTLADANTGDHLSEQDIALYLSGTDAAANPQSGSSYLTLSAASTKVHLFVLPTFHDKGVFAGTLALCSAGKASVATLKLTVNASTPTARISGALLIAAGIAIYVLVTVILRQRSRQLTALLPASRLVEALRTLQATAKGVAQKAKVSLPILLGNEKVENSLESLISKLSTKNLQKQGFLPPLLTNPFQAPDPGTDYQQFLQGIGTVEMNLAIIVRDGLERVMFLWPTLDEESARKGLGQLDDLTSQADAPDPMRQKVDKTVSDIHRRGGAESRASLAFVPSGAVAPTPSVQEITVQLEYLSGLGWLIWALLTFLIGCAVLILSNHGFGTWQDLAKCLAWGLGIQAAGQGLQALSPTSASSSFSLQIGH